MKFQKRKFLFSISYLTKFRYIVKLLATLRETQLRKALRIEIRRINLKRKSIKDNRLNHLKYKRRPFTVSKLV